MKVRELMTTDVTRAELGTTLDFHRHAAGRCGRRTDPWRKSS
jgi:hypothetical protein